MNSFSRRKCVEESQLKYSGNWLQITRLLGVLSFFFSHLFVYQCELHLSHKIRVPKRGIVLTQFMLRLVVRDDDIGPHILDLAVKCAEFMRVTFMVLIEHPLKESQSIQIISIWSTRYDSRSEEQFWLYKCLEELLTRMQWKLSSNNRTARCLFSFSCFSIVYLASVDSAPVELIVWSDDKERIVFEIWPWKIKSMSELFMVLIKHFYEVKNLINGTHQDLKKPLFRISVLSIRDIWLYMWI